jgi:drug/metabolite transporter (DMT)-like permease
MTRYKGYLMVIVGASLWGLSGPVVQKLFHEYGFTTDGLVTMRMICAGMLLLVVASYQTGMRQVLSIWTDQKDRIGVLLFALLGMLGVQYTFFAAIETGNAATATLLQYLSPLVITVYVALRTKKVPTSQELVALGLALAGTFLLLTNGSLQGLTISWPGLWWGLATALTMAFYTIQPVALLNRRGAVTVVGWGMLIGGAALGLSVHQWEAGVQSWSALTLAYVIFVILFGTLVPFYLYMESLRHIKGTEASVLSSAEPLTAMVVSVLWLQVPLGFFEAVGGLCIISTVILLSWRRSESKAPS